MSDIRTDVTQGNNILLSDYNNVQTKIANVLGTGSGQSGYGQSLASSQLAANSVIDDAHWDSLRTDLLKARQHQTGVDESANLTDIAAGQVVDDAVITGYENFATTVETNKFSVAANQTSQSAAVLASGTLGAWNVNFIATVTFSFGSADQARYFFNSGGRVLFYGSAGVNGGGAKDQTWFNMTNGVGREVNGSAFYGLTNNYVRLASIGAAAGVYVENRYYIDIACNVANNSSGGATTVTARFIFEDNDLGDKTGTGAAVDENVTTAVAYGYFIRASGNNVDVSGPTISA